MSLTVSENFLQVAIMSQKHLLDDYIQTNESYMNNKIDLLVKEEKKLQNLGDLEKIEAFNEDHDADYFYYSTAFPNILRKSISILIYSNLEHSLNKISECIYYSRKLKIKYKDIEGKGIFKTIKHLHLLLGIDLTNTKQWNDIITYNKMRNSFAHNNGLIFENEIKGSSYYKKKLLTLENIFQENGKNIGKIKFEKGSLEYLNNVSNDFIKYIFMELDKIS